MNLTNTQLQAALDEWLENRCPTADWQSKTFDCYSAFPIIVRIHAMTNYFEMEICNGGLAQFLWNAFFHWEEVLTVCEKGYYEMNAIQQAAAIPMFRIKILEHIALCQGFISKAQQRQNMKAFKDWYEIAEETMSMPEENLFYAADDSELLNLRAKWIARHTDEILSIIHKQNQESSQSRVRVNPQDER